jgi:hypothetical protein
MRPGKQAILANERGIITFDFIFAFAVAMGMMVLFFRIAMTFASVEVVQYIAFSVSRVYLAAHNTPEQQEAQARKKFAELAALPTVRKFTSGSWFSLGEVAIGNFNSEYPIEADKDAAVFVGARIPFQAKMLNVNIPFIGASQDDDKVGRATLNSYLMREPTTTECRAFNQQRFEQIQSALGYSIPGASASAYTLVQDNGC